MNEPKWDERDEPEPEPEAEAEARAADGAPEEDDEVEAHGQFFHRPSE